MIVKIKKPNAAAKALFDAAFPSYRGRKWSLIESETARVNDYWDGGSKTTTVFVDGATMQVFSGAAMLDKQGAQQTRANPFNVPLGDITLRPGLVAVQQITFRGKNLGLRLTAVADDAKTLLDGCEL